MLMAFLRSQLSPARILRTAFRAAVRRSENVADDGAKTSLIGLTESRPVNAAIRLGHLCRSSFIMAKSYELFIDDVILNILS